jgi:hypothetical protein
MMSFGQDDVIRISTPRKLVCPQIHVFFTDSMSLFVKLWCDNSVSDSSSIPLTYTSFNPEVEVNNPRLPANKILPLLPSCLESWHNAVSTATGCRLHDRGAGVRIPVW